MCSFADDNIVFARHQIKHLYYRKHVLLNEFWKIPTLFLNLIDALIKQRDRRTQILHFGFFFNFEKRPTLSKLTEKHKNGFTIN